MSPHSLLIIGAGGHGRAIAELVELGGQFSIAGFVDDGWPQLHEVWHYPVLGAIADLPRFKPCASHAFVAIGNNRVRLQLLHQLETMQFAVPNLLHPRACVSPRAVLGTGVAVMAGAVVGCEAVLADGVIVNAGAVVDHHCVVGRCGHFGVGAFAAGGVRVGEGAWLQAGCALGYRVVVDDWAILAPGTALSAA
ncbi:NeuD/PglB/VioB family sugar acetyltransferase [Chitiniphilus purpureus]|uniref:NeuD/PglB/VioB family sugar acetyltransferase n=1 Tax=Chitiniphilus purpureus TaxID=2981137 RepID=A0ABY6DJD7_9NEIS|nr:NeuD/PglB/VioB family sugar acetyltransferase [Chitiniphilus sp. CD1]UXY14470.1 NeuD/PglB/VioB family sugar acetyltransferase [Chitiniphilus sp. CD1]